MSARVPLSFGCLLVCLAATFSRPRESLAEQLPYGRVLEQYRSRDYEAALAAFTRTRPEIIQANVEDLLRQRPSEIDIKTATLLHTEAAYFGELPLGVADVHAAAARVLVDALDKKRLAATFRKNWMLLATIASQGRSFDLENLERSLRPLELAEERWPEDAMVQLALGVGRERAFAILDEPVLLDDAERHYRKALKAEPSLAEAHLRLGHILFLTEDGSNSAEAMQELEWVIRHTRVPELHYLSQFFRSRLHRRLGDVDAAVRALRAAVSANPEGQSALLALSQSLHAAGEHQEAGEVLMRALALPVTEPGYTDDFTLYRAGLIRWLGTFLALLRAELTTEVG